MILGPVLALAFAASAALAETFTVSVGPSGTKTYVPDNVKARIGDVVNFVFEGGNHTVTQSTFADPCTNAGFKSGFRPSGTANTFAIQINSTEPVWVYCGQTGHCQAGMVMAINAADSGDKTFEAFRAIAMGRPAAGSDADPSAGPSGQAGASAAGSDGAYGGSPTASQSAGASGTSGTAASSTPSGGALPLAMPRFLGLVPVMLLSLGLL